MATKVEGIKFLVVEGKGSEFLAVGFGGGNVEDRGVITSGVFEGFTHIVVGGGEELICDHCNEHIEDDATCYYVAVLNSILCKECFEHWIANAKYYQEDASIERKNYEYCLDLFHKKSFE